MNPFQLRLVRLLEAGCEDNDMLCDAIRSCIEHTERTRLEALLAEQRRCEGLSSEVAAVWSSQSPTSRQGPSAQRVFAEAGLPALQGGSDSTLVGMGATIDFPVSERCGMTPLEIAVLTQNEVAAEALLSNGADPECTSGLACTCLFKLCQQFPTAISMMRLFLTHGANPDCTADNDTTSASCLLVSVAKGHSEAVRLLLEFGADASYPWHQPSAEGPRSMTALELSEELGFDDITLLLREYKAGDAAERRWERHLTCQESRMSAQEVQELYRKQVLIEDRLSRKCARSHPDESPSRGLSSNDEVVVGSPVGTPEPSDSGPESSWLIGLDCIEVGAPISSGAHGEVFRGWMGPRGSRRPVAIKKFPCTSARSRDCFRREVSLLSSFKHPCILPFFGAVVTEDLCAIIMELCDDNLTGALGSVDVELAVNNAGAEVPSQTASMLVSSSLEALPHSEPLGVAHTSLRMPKWEDAACWSAVREMPPVPWADRLRWAHQLALALQYLHSREPYPIVHRDLKSLNVLLCRRSNGESITLPVTVPSSDLDVRLCDFGMARTKEHTNIHTHHIAGSPGWMAPEVLRGDDFNDRSDVFSYGVVLWELLMRRVPWGGLKMPQLVGKVGFTGAQLPGVAAIPYLDTLPERCSDRDAVYTTSYYAQCMKGAPTRLYLTLMHRCLRHNPADRPSINDVLRDFNLILCGVD